MTSDLQHHLDRARRERDLAYRSADARASDSHMKLSALHLKRALELGASELAALGLSALPCNEEMPLLRSAQS
jgi:hypothetical protein